MFRKVLESLYGLPKHRFLYYAIVCIFCTVLLTGVGSWYEGQQNQRNIKTFLNIVSHVSNAVTTSFFIAAILDLSGGGIVVFTGWAWDKFWIQKHRTPSEKKKQELKNELVNIQETLDRLIKIAGELRDEEEDSTSPSPPNSGVSPTYR